MCRRRATWCVSGSLLLQTGRFPFGGPFGDRRHDVCRAELPYAQRAGPSCGNCGTEPGCAMAVGACSADRRLRGRGNGHGTGVHAGDPRTERLASRVSPRLGANRGGTAHRRREGPTSADRCGVGADSDDLVFHVDGRRGLLQACRFLELGPYRHALVGPRAVDHWYTTGPLGFLGSAEGPATPVPRRDRNGRDRWPYLHSAQCRDRVALYVRSILDHGPEGAGPLAGGRRGGPPDLPEHELSLDFRPVSPPRGRRTGRVGGPARG